MLHSAGHKSKHWTGVPGREAVLGGQAQRPAGEADPRLCRAVRPMRRPRLALPPRLLWSCSPSPVPSSSGRQLFWTPGPSHGLTGHLTMASFSSSSSHPPGRFSSWTCHHLPSADHCWTDPGFALLSEATGHMCDAKFNTFVSGLERTLVL